MKLDVQDTTGQDWRVARRFLPWVRLIQPYNMIEGERKRSGVTHRRAPDNRSRTQRKIRREQRLKKATTPDRGGIHWLWMFPVMLVIVGAACLAEAVVAFVKLLIWLVLFPMWIIEQAAALLVGSVLWLLRVTAVARSRVDVVGWWGWSPKMNSLSIVLVRGYGTAGGLVQALAIERQASLGPFEPVRDAAAGQILAEAGATVTQHDSIWSSAANPMLPASR